MGNGCRVRRFAVTQPSPSLARLLLLLFVLTSAFATQAQGLKGVVANEAGEGLPFASIRVQGTAQGTVCNVEGRYQLALAPGSYTVLFQSLGYATLVRSVEVGSSTMTLDVRLAAQTYQLSEVTVGKQEDPAYSIMRKAIAKAPIERQKVTGYTAMVYIKGGGRLIDAPWLLEGKLKEEGIDKNTVFFNETVSELTYRAPNFYKNRAISIRTNMDRGGRSFPSPNQYINQSFYQPTVGSAVSPLSPRAFSYYRFSYEGVFMDRGVEVNKIRVKPKQGGDDVFDGYIYIIEGEWCLHSLSLKERHEGIFVETNQIYTPIQQVWMPATQKYKINGDIWGFEFEGTYVASLRDYKLTVNKALVAPVVVIDETKDKEEAKAVRKEEAKTPSELSKVLRDTSGGKKFTRKGLRKLAKELRKQEKEEIRKENQGDDVAVIDSTVVDSMAYKRDSAYWLANRAVPLTEMEVKSTVKLDSIQVKHEEKDRKDSARKAKLSGNASSKGFKSFDEVFNGLVFGHTFRLSEKKSDTLYRRHEIRYGGLISGDAGYNTVEGYVLESTLRYRYHGWAKKTNVAHDFYFGPRARYEFARENVLGILESGYSYKNGWLRAAGGRYISQVNPEGAIDPALNAVSSLLFERNFMRLFEKDYVRLETENTFADKFQLNTGFELAERRYLNNHVKGPFVNWHDRIYAPNYDPNVYSPTGNTYFQNHRAAIANFSAIYTPTVRYGIHNGHKSYIPGQEPYFHAKVNVGIPNIAQSTTNFLNAALGLEQRLTLGVRATINYYVEAGAFLYNKQTYMPDYFHFQGNQTFLIVGDGISAFRTLPYYKFSTPIRYAQQHVVYTPRRFLLTRILYVELLGWKESFGYHGLTVPNQPQYSELTYGFDGIFRFVRVEGVAVFNNAKYDRFAFRIGVTLKRKNPGLKRSSPEGSDERRSVNITL